MHRVTSLHNFTHTHYRADDACWMLFSADSAQGYNNLKTFVRDLYIHCTERKLDPLLVIKL